MKELYIRGISGGLYVALIVGSVFTHQLLFTLTILLFSTLAIIEFQRLIHHKSYMPMALVILLVYNFYQSKIEVSDLLYPLISIFIAHFFLLYWLFTQKKIQFGYLSKTLLTLFYVGLGCFFIITLGGSGSDYHPEDVLLFYLLIWTNNSFAYLVGKNSEKNLYMLPSPPKNLGKGFLVDLFFVV